MMFLFSNEQAMAKLSFELASILNRQDHFGVKYHMLICYVLVGLLFHLSGIDLMANSFHQIDADLLNTTGT